jgi:hypothetical protein
MQLELKVALPNVSRQSLRWKKWTWTAVMRNETAALQDSSKRCRTLSHCAVARKQRKRVRIVCAATSRNHKTRKKSPSDGNARVELYSHADAAVFGMDCRVINDMGTVVSVDDFEPTFQSHRKS